MAVKVFFENKKHSELVAVFDNEDLYNVCVKPLEKLAKEWRMELSESVHSEDMDIKPDKFREAVIKAAKDSLDKECLNGGDVHLFYDKKINRYMSIAAPADSLDEFKGMDAGSIFRKLWESSQLNKI